MTMATLATLEIIAIATLHILYRILVWSYPQTKSKTVGFSAPKNQKTLRRAYSVDFDDTLCFSAYPDTGCPNKRLIKYLIKRRALGDRVILNTCRTGEALVEAVGWCKEQGLEFDAVNENLQERILFFGGDCRKISADYHIDDKNLFLLGIGKSLCLKNAGIGFFK